MSAPPVSPGKQNSDEQKKREEQSRRRFRFAVGYFITSMLVLWLYPLFFLNQATRNAEIPYSDFKKDLAAGQIVSVTVGERIIAGEMKNPQAGKSPATVPFNTIPAPAGDPQLIEQLQNANV